MLTPRPHLVRPTEQVLVNQTFRGVA
jgi:hypothetical protein